MTTRIVELRSDTFTRPTQAMRRAMYDSEVGDDVWNEDPTVHALERRAAELTGKAAALFVTSGTQGNLVGLLSHTRPGQEIILGDRSHIFVNEAAGSAIVGGLQAHILVNTPQGRLRPEEVRAAIRGTDIHFPPTGAVVLENTHNLCGGQVITPAETAEIAGIAHERGVKLHIDGARIFNASVALGVNVSVLAAPADSITFCLSKGLGAPVGSLVCGDVDYIERARKWRKILGGGMRQAGVLAAAGLVALEQNIERLAEDHANAKLLAEGLAQIPGISIDPGAVETNIVFFKLANASLDSEAFERGLTERGVRVSGAGGNYRAVTSYEVSRDDIEHALAVVSDVAAARQPAPV